MKKEKVKSFFYNNCVDFLVFISVLVVLAIAYLVSKNFGVFVEFLIIGIMYFVWKYKTRKANKDLFYFKCSYSILAPYCIWINQDVRKNRNQDECPQEAFMREMCKIIKETPAGTVCYCCTHEAIKRQIIKKYPNAIVFEAYKKDLLKLKKKLKTEKCEKCEKAKECSLFKHEDTQFYSIRFIK